MLTRVTPPKKCLLSQKNRIFVQRKLILSENDKNEISYLITKTMALIICPECGRQVSDLATQCPNCGRPLKPSATPTPPPIPGSGAPSNPLPSNPTPTQPTPSTASTINSSSSRQEKVSTQILKCPYCKAELGTKDIINSGWAKCPSCKKEIKLNGTNGEFDDNLIIEKILPFSTTKDTCHRTLMQHLMKIGPWDTFDNLKVIDIKRKFMWVREFGKGERRAIYPLCKTGLNFFNRMFGKDYIKADVYETCFPTKDMVNFSGDEIRDTEILTKELDASNSHCMVENIEEICNYSPTSHYYCLPILEEIVEYRGKQYSLIRTGCDKSPFYYSDVSTFPKSEELEAMPKYTNMKPVLYTACGLIGGYLLLAIIAMFAEGFWIGLICLIFAGVLCAVIGPFIFGAIAIVATIADTAICAFINKKRRINFRNKLEEIQEHKKNTAKKKWKLDLTYEIAEYPIP